MSKMPTVLTRSKTTNQTLLPFWADFQRAIPFQTKDHKTTTANTNPTAPAKKEELLVSQNFANP